jgi:hypothetical protein
MFFRFKTFFVLTLVFLFAFAAIAGAAHSIINRILKQGDVYEVERQETSRGSGM